MNNTLELLYNHSSIRSFTNQPDFKAAIQTSSISLLQVVSIID
ncbi:hypothetical protein QFZ31_000712 [Neobacillus niacini]|nr:hypothetical protein [Neobacillus niacini]MDQ0970834.1 hypothetical protein [Neobacillus niacini]